MSNSADVAQLYKNVIEEVIKTVRTDFVNMGVDEQVLVDLQTLWEQKLIESRVFRPQDFPITAARDYAGGAGFFYPGAPAMRPVYGQSVATMPLAQPFPPMPSYQMAYFPPARPAMPPVIAPPGGIPPNITTHVRPNTVARSTLPPPPSKPSDPRETSTTATPTATTATTTTTSSNTSSSTIPTDSQSNNEPPSSSSSFPPAIGQYDGMADEGPVLLSIPRGAAIEFDFELPPRMALPEDVDDGSRERDDTASNPLNNSTVEGKRESELAKSLPPLSVSADVGKRTRPEDELGSDLDDDEDDLNGGDDENINDLILCQYEKINRVRTRWRGILRAGIVHIENSDYCFSRANTDFDW